VCYVVRRLARLYFNYLISTGFSCLCVFEGGGGDPLFSLGKRMSYFFFGFNDFFLRKERMPV
jgi:hypothetical protein